MSASFDTLAGAEKAALVLLGLGQEVASEVIKHLGEREIVSLRACVKDLKPHAFGSLDPMFAEFEGLMNKDAMIPGQDPRAYLRELATHAFGAERAAELFSEPLAKVEPMEAIRSARTIALAELLEDEHPQVAAVIASQLPRSQAAQVMSAMSAKKQVELLGRIALLKEIPRETVQAASEALAKALQASGALANAGARRDFDGVTFAAGLLNEIPSSESERILNEMQDRFAKVAPKIREAMFTFDDLGRLNVRGLQVLMREVSSETMLIALKTASEMMREHFLSAVSSRAAEAMRDDLQVMPPMRLSEVEEAQREIVEAALRLATDGRLMLPGNSSEKLV